MSESKKQIVIVCAVSVIIALSLGAGIYYTQASPSNPQSTTTVTQALGYTFTNSGDTICTCLHPKNSTSLQAVGVGKSPPPPIPIWSDVATGNNLADIKVAVVELIPGSVGHLCVAYPVGKFVGGTPPNSNIVSFNPIAYDASNFTGVPISQSAFHISAQPNLVTFPGNTSGYLLVDYSFSSD